MEQTRFDRLTVQLADGTTRRTLLNRLGGASLAAVFSMIGLRQAPDRSDARGRNQPAKHWRGRRTQTAGVTTYAPRPTPVARRAGRAAPPMISAAAI